MRDAVAVNQLGRTLRSGDSVDDDVFDRYYPSTHRHRSEIHWSPVEVALVVSRWFARARNPRILDVGAGIGKLCHVGALATDLDWHGIERDATMVRIATRVGHALGLGSRVTFFHGEALDHDWSAYGAVYLFNPFTEACLKESVDPLTRHAGYIHEVLSVERKLAALHAGTMVATFHGFGGEMPAAFDRVDATTFDRGVLELWTHRGPG